MLRLVSKKMGPVDMTICTHTIRSDPGPTEVFSKMVVISLKMNGWKGKRHENKVSMEYSLKELMSWICSDERRLNCCNFLHEAKLSKHSLL